MIGNELEPGVTASVRSINTLSAADSSPGTPVLVGGADLTEGNATPAQVEAVTRPSEARDLFGEESQLTRNAVDALGNGAFPVLAVAAPETTESVDLTGIANPTASVGSPLKEEVEEITATADSSDLTVYPTLKDLASVTVGSNEVYVNLDTGRFKLESLPSSSMLISPPSSKGTSSPVSSSRSNQFDHP